MPRDILLLQKKLIPIFQREKFCGFRDLFIPFPFSIRWANISFEN